MRFLIKNLLSLFELKVSYSSAILVLVPKNCHVLNWQTPPSPTLTFCVKLLDSPPYILTRIFERPRRFFFKLNSSVEFDFLQLLPMTSSFILFSSLTPSNQPGVNPVRRTILQNNDSVLNFFDVHSIQILQRSGLICINHNH